MSKMILVACMLPCGLTVDGLDGQNSLELNGTNTALVPGAPGLTNVDEDEWLYVKAQYASHAAFVNQSIYAHGESASVADVLAMGEELKDIPTGFEGIDPRKPDENLQPLDDRKLEQSLIEAQATNGPRKQVEGADRVAALEAAAGKPKVAGKGKR